MRRAERLPASRRLGIHITIGCADFHESAHHETASKILGQQFLGLNIRQANRRIACSSEITLMDFVQPIRFNGG